MTQDRDVEDRVRQRIRSLRKARGWTLDEMARRCLLNPSTLSRIETGQRRIALDQLAPIARALGSSIDELLATTDDEDEVIIRPHHDKISGMSVWPLTRNRDPNGTQVVKMRIAARRRPSLQVHPGRDWFFVLSGTARLLLGDREIFVATGQAAEFATMTPHWIGAHGGPVELLSIFDLNGEKAHLRATPTAAKARRTS